MPLRLSLISRRAFAGLTVACLLAWPAAAKDRAALEAKAEGALAQLHQSHPKTQDMTKNASAVLIFPEIVRAGLLVGASGGEGVLKVGGETEGYYLSTAASYGLQAGVATYGYVMFFMDEASLKYLRESAGWEVGVGPNVTIADEGLAKSLTTSSLQEGIYVFFVDQKGFFAGSGIEGSKITKED